MEDKKKEKKKFNDRQQLIASLLIAMVVLFAIFGTNTRPKKAAEVSPDGYPISRNVYLLDTFCQLTIYDGGGEEAMASAVDELNRYDDMLNKSKPDSDIARINNRTEENVEIEPETADMLSFAREFCAETNGILEPAIKPVTDLWDFKEKKEIPDEAELEAALLKVKSLAWDIEGNTFKAYDPDVQIDIGSFAKGYVADRIKEDMLEHGVTSAIINLGGNELCVGSRPDGEPFRIAIAEPDKNENEYHILELTDTSAVTAGTYMRYFIKDGVRYHHILDPETGYPVQNGLLSVTVVGEQSVVCDALCTSIFIMGEEKGTEFLDSYNREHGTDYYSVFIRENE